MAKRVKLLAGNWKMHKTLAELGPFFEAFSDSVGLNSEPAMTRQVEIIFAAPYIFLQKFHEIASPKGIRIAAQNVHWEKEGAYTGEVSINMIKDVGITTTLIGHSERRQYFCETDETVGKKAQAALQHQVTPIVCVGESLEERENGMTREVISRQVHAFIDKISDPKDLIIAYEPVWAIGTGRSATSAQAQDVHAFIREILTQRWKAEGEGLRLLYGGSANPGNIEELLAQPDIDGALVGGASLKPADFASMVRAGLVAARR